MIRHRSKKQDNLSLSMMRQTRLATPTSSAQCARVLHVYSSSYFQFHFRHFFYFWKRAINPIPSIVIVQLATSSDLSPLRCATVSVLTFFHFVSSIPCWLFTDNITKYVIPHRCFRSWKQCWCWLGFHCHHFHQLQCRYQHNNSCSKFHANPRACGSAKSCSAHAIFAGRCHSHHLLICWFPRYVPIPLSAEQMVERPNHSTLVGWPVARFFTHRLYFETRHSRLQFWQIPRVLTVTSTKLKTGDSNPTFFLRRWWWQWKCSSRWCW